MIKRRTFTASVLAAIPAAGLLGTVAFAQDLREITFVQPSPSVINSFPVFVAIGEGYFEEEGLKVTVEAINGSGAVLQALSAGQAHFGRPGPGPLRRHCDQAARSVSWSQQAKSAATPLRRHCRAACEMVSGHSLTVGMMQIWSAETCQPREHCDAFMGVSYAARPCDSKTDGVFPSAMTNAPKSS